LLPDRVSTQPVPLNRLAPNGTLQISSIATVPWLVKTYGNINEPALGNIPVSVLPAGSYYLYLIVTPAGSITNYYLWTTLVTFGDNVLPVSVNGPLCAIGSYTNKPCVSVTVCSPGTTLCQTIDDVLLDTGSFGLRIFSQVLNVSLGSMPGFSGSLGECVQYGDGTSNWGPVQTADVILGKEPVVRVPVQVIDAAFGTLPASCQNALQNPAEAGYNGILGVGLMAADCGPLCEVLPNNKIYYVCNGQNCSPTTVPLASQVQNPVALLPGDNNGVILRLPQVSSQGAAMASGYLMLGIGTRANNIAAGVTAYTADLSGDFTTFFNGAYYNGFIDSGSNALFFHGGSTGVLPACAPPNAVWFCPSALTTLSAVNIGASGAPSGSVSFQVGNLLQLLGSSRNVFPDIAGERAGSFDWGLPFFFGRDVFVGLEQTRSSLGIGPYWAY
jgi:hypothetical protein